MLKQTYSYISITIFSNQLIVFNYCCLTLIILFKINHLFTHSEVVTRGKYVTQEPKNVGDQARSGRPKTVDSEAVLRAIEQNPMSRTRTWFGLL